MKFIQNALAVVLLIAAGVFLVVMNNARTHGTMHENLLLLGILLAVVVVSGVAFWLLLKLEKKNKDKK